LLRRSVCGLPLFQLRGHYTSSLPRPRLALLGALLAPGIQACSTVQV
jgi:hypothetical protein